MRVTEQELKAYAEKKADVSTIYKDLINKITTNGTRTTSCLAAATIANLYGIEGLNALEDAGLITYAGQNSNNYAVYVIA